MASSHNPYISRSHNDENPPDPSAEVSANDSKLGARPSKGKQQVKFLPGGESLEGENVRTLYDIREDVSSLETKTASPLSQTRTSPLQLEEGDVIPSPRAAKIKHSKNITSRSNRPFLPRIKPLTPINPQLVKNTSTRSRLGEDTDESGKEEGEKKAVDLENFQYTAQHRTERHSRRRGSHSAPGSKRASADGSLQASPTLFEPAGLTLDLNNFPLERLEHRTTYGIDDDTEEENEHNQAEESGSTWMGRIMSAARRIVRYPSSKSSAGLYRVWASLPDLRAGESTPIYEQNPDGHVSGPETYRRGFLTSFLKLCKEEGIGPVIAGSPTAAHVVHHNYQGNSKEPFDETPSFGDAAGATPASSGCNTPKLEKQKWYGNSTSGSAVTLTNLVNTTNMLAQPAISMDTPDQSLAIRPSLLSRLSTNPFDKILGKSFAKRRKSADNSNQIEVHVVETISRQTYLLKLCRALIQYGAPTHRLEGK